RLPHLRLPRFPLPVIPSGLLAPLPKPPVSSLGSATQLQSAAAPIRTHPSTRTNLGANCVFTRVLWTRPPLLRGHHPRLWPKSRPCWRGWVLRFSWRASTSTGASVTRRRRGRLVLRELLPTVIQLTSLLYKSPAALLRMG